MSYPQPTYLPGCTDIEEARAIEGLGYRRDHGAPLFDLVGFGFNEFRQIEGSLN
jgi:hypothetical protein